MKLPLPLSKISDCASRDLVECMLCMLCKEMEKTDALFFDRKASQNPEKYSYNIRGRTPPLLQQIKVEESTLGAEVIEESKQEILVTRECLSSFMTEMCINNQLKDILCVTLVILVSRAKLIFVSGQNLLVSSAHVQNFRKQRIKLEMDHNSSINKNGAVERETRGLRIDNPIRAQGRWQIQLLYPLKDIPLDSQITENIPLKESYGVPRRQWVKHIC